ncbi:MAG: DeoR/GlpR family DNA-binding transcription regulator [Lentisphaeria bacterium]|jgi:DeoR/GlpR family transcriptional regulator of sugar metabolism
MSTDQRLLTAERETKILDLLRRHGLLAVARIAAELGVSPATIRRDLHSLQERKLLQRVRGGATVKNLARAEPLFQAKEAQNAAAKERIAARALERIDDHDILYLDGGSTVLMLARLLAAKRDLTVVTNSLMAAAVLMAQPHRLILVGGEFRPLARTLVGPLTAPVIQSLHFHKAFMGTIGLTLEEGMSTTDPGEAFTKEQAMNRANLVFLLADSSKLGVPSFARSGTLEDLDVLITEAMGDEFRAALEERGVEVVLA